MKYYLIEFDLYERVVAISVHETEEAREIARIQLINRPGGYHDFQYFDDVQ